MGLTVATPSPIPLDEGMGFVGVTGRLPKAGFSRSRQSGVGLSCSRPRDSAASGQSVALLPTSQKVALRPGVLRGATCPDVLKGSGTRVGLPGAHYSDSNPLIRVQASVTPATDNKQIMNILQHPTAGTSHICARQRAP